MGVPGMTILFSEMITKYIPGYKNWMSFLLNKDMPDWAKNLQLPMQQYGKDAPQEPVEFIGDLLGGLAPVALSSIAGIPPSIDFL